MQHAFSPNTQIISKQAKIIVGIERLSTLFRSSLQEQANSVDISPLQIQILLFVAHHHTRLCNVSSLAHEFALKKPTISDAVRVLIEKQLLTKIVQPQDARSFALVPSVKADQLLENVLGLSGFFVDAMQSMTEAEMDTVWQGILTLLRHLHIQGAVPLRMCFSCQFFVEREAQDQPHYCKLMQQALPMHDLRLDCNEYAVA